MAGDWLKFEANTPEKVEVLAITVEMGWEDPDLTVGKLLRVWRWFDQHTVEGNAVGVTTALLDRIIGVTGFAKAMVNVGWLIVADDGISLPNFGRHNGKTAKDRALTAKRVASHKVSVKANAESNGESVTEALPREEKRREDKNNTSTNVEVVASQADDQSSQRPKLTKPQCPHQEIIALYHELLPANPSIRDWTPARAEHLRVRWNEDPKRQTLDWWRRFFAYIGESAFLTGRATAKDRKPFAPGLDWIVKAENFTKIREGRYHEQEAA